MLGFGSGGKMATQTLDAKLQELLRGRHIATLATENADGSMHLTAVWYLFEDGALFVATSTKTRKYPSKLLAGKLSGGAAEGFVDGGFAAAWDGMGGVCGGGGGGDCVGRGRRRLLSLVATEPRHQRRARALCRASSCTM